MGCGSSVYRGSIKWRAPPSDKCSDLANKQSEDVFSPSNGNPLTSLAKVKPPDCPPVQLIEPASKSSTAAPPLEGAPPLAPLQFPEKQFKIWEHVRDAVRLWGDKGGGYCQPQPLFDAISALMTVDRQAQKLCGCHLASVHMGSNAKVARALVPFVESEAIGHLSPAGTLSLSARMPLDELGLKERLEEFLMGDIRIEDPDILHAIHAQDVDWADVDNGAAVLSLANCLKLSGAKHFLHTFVSQRRFSAEFAPTVIHKDDAGIPIKTEVMTDGNGNAIQGLQFRITDSDDLSKFSVKPSVLPYIKELEFEANIHNEEDMHELAIFECAVLSKQLRRAGLGDTKVALSGCLESAGLSGNVHKLTWYLYNHDGSTRTPAAYRKDADMFFECGIGNSKARRGKFQEYTNIKSGPLQEMPAPGNFEDFFAYCRKHPDDKIVVHCGGPLFLVRELAKQADLRERVILIGSMFLSYDGQANLLGMNFNEGVALNLTAEVFGEDGKQLHRSFPNAQVLCVTTETCKSPCLAFVPFLDTVPDQDFLGKRASNASLRPEMPIPEKTKNQPLLIISDDGKDPDDEVAKILLSSLTRRGLAVCYGFISNLNPSKDRARLAKGTLNELNLGDIPVGVGENMITSTSGSYEFNAPYLADLKDCHENGVEMFVQILKKLDEDEQVTLVCLSGLTDAWKLMNNHRELFRAKISRVVIMGGVEVDGDEVKLDSDGYMIPDKAQNNTFDFPSAQEFYRNLQRESIPLTVVTRWAAYAAKLSFSLYDAMEATGHPVGTRLHGSQRHSLEHLWQRVQLAGDDPKREGLPGRCDKAWFCKIFLGGKGLERDGGSIWDLASTFQAYDPVALLAALHGVRARFMRPLLVDVEGLRGVQQHEILGMNEKESGIAEGSELADWLQTAIVTGLVKKAT